MNETYNKDTIDEKIHSVHGRFDAQDKILVEIKEQTTRTNGRVNKLERNLIIVACITGTVLLLKFPEVFEALKTFL